MTSTLRDILDDLVTAVPGHVASPGLAEKSRAAGKRRRIRRRIVRSAVAAAVVALVAAVVVPGVPEWRSQPAGADHYSDGVTSYPQRIGHQWWVRDLPDRPGPIAGLIELSGGGTWHAMSSAGHRWRLPAHADEVPTVSPNGRYVGYLASRTGPYVIRDLVDGTTTEFGEITSGLNYPSADNNAPSYLSGQAPSYWSPDGTRVWVPAYPRSGNSSGMVLGVDGTSQPVTRDEWPGYMVGWNSDDQLVFAHWDSSDPDDEYGPVERYLARALTTDGVVLGSVPLNIPPGATPGLSQWAGAVSPDNASLSLQLRPEETYEGRLHQLDLETGQLVAEPIGVDDDAVCPLGWAGTEPTLPIWDIESDNAVTAVVRDGTPEPIVVIEPGLGSYCVLWASDALAGGPRDGILDMSMGWWTWWWRELLAGFAVLLVGSATIARYVRSRRLRKPLEDGVEHPMR